MKLFKGRVDRARIINISDMIPIIFLPLTYPVSNSRPNATVTNLLSENK